MLILESPPGADLAAIYVEFRHVLGYADLVIIYVGPGVGLAGPMLRSTPPHGGFPK